MALPDFFVIGAPKAGTTALHAALAQHPRLFMPPVKEPKFFLCDGPPPDHGGPGDAHSYREWIWRPGDYERLFDGAPPGALRGRARPSTCPTTLPSGASAPRFPMPGSSPSCATRSIGPTPTGPTCGPTASRPPGTS